MLVEFPFSSGTGKKLRPALVVQNDHNNQRLTNVIIAAITTTTHRSAEATQLFIDVSNAAGTRTGLMRDSVVTCENLITVAQSLIRRKIGQLAPAMMVGIDDCLKASLDIR